MSKRLNAVHVTALPTDLFRKYKVELEKLVLTCPLD